MESPLTAIAVFVASVVLAVVFRSPAAFAAAAALAALYFYPYVALLVLGVAIFIAVTH